MKLIHLSMKNITSFKGVHEIDFAFLNEENLFAITGQTGTGKSSILTAISLALYGKNYKKTLSSNDFVSLGASDAYAKLIFKHNQEIYTAVWEIKLKKKDNSPIKLVSPKRYLARNDVLLEGTAAQLLNLSFEQFTKTVILNQGEFSKFLTSTFSERRSILEKLHGCEQISILGKFLSARLKDWKAQMATTQSLIDNAQTYSKEDIDQLNLVILSTQKRLQEYESLLNLLAKQQSLSRELFNSLNKHLHDTQLLKQREDEYAKALEIYQADNANLNQLTVTLDTHRKNYQTISPKLQQAIKFQQIIKNSAVQLIALDRQLQTLNIYLDEKKSRQAYLFNKIKNNGELLQLQITRDPDLFDPNFNQDLAHDLLNQLQKHSSEFQLLEQSLQINQSQIASAKSKVSNALETLELENNTLRDNTANLILREPELHYQKQQTLLSKYHTSQEIHKGLQLLELKKQTITTHLNDQTKELDSLVKQASFLNENLQIRLEQFKKNTLLNAIVLCRHESNQAGKCLVCDQPLATLLEITAKGYPDDQSLVEKQQGELNTVTEQIIRTQELKKRLHQDLELVSQEYLKLTAGYNPPDEIKIELGTLEKIIQNIEGIKNKIIQTNSKIESVTEFLTKEQAELVNLEQIKQNNTTLLKSKTDSINFIKNKIAKDYPRYHILLSDAFLLLSRDQSLLNTHTLLTKENIVLKDELGTIGGDLKSALEQKTNCLAQINNLQLENQENTKQLNLLTNESNPEEKLIMLQKELDTLELMRAQKMQETREKERQKDQLLEKIKNIQHDQKDLKLLQLEMITGLKKLCLDDIQLDLELTCNLMFTSYHKAYQKILLINIDQVSSQLPVIIEIFINESLSPLMESIKTSIQNFNVLLIESRLKIQNHLEQEKRLVYYQNEYQQIQQKYLTSADLFKVIGVSDFRNFVNGFIEKKLLIYTNHELKKLYLGRYEITTVSGPNGNEFFILDHYYNGQLRKIHTLSGGEIFLVSLAMALSLAEMSKGQTDIESFFIDEGFGNLDQDSIEDALMVLSKIKGQGKHIGIISHVRELTSKIAINIDLLKSPLGESSIDIVYN